MTGRVESINVARVRDNPWTREGNAHTGIDKRPVGGPVRLDVLGVDGDTICDTKNHGGVDQAVYAYDAEDMAFWARELGQQLAPGAVGENLSTSGVDCSHAVVGARWRIGTALLQVRAPRIPCRVFAGFRGVPDLVKRFSAALRPGCYLAVLEPGTAQAGDDVVQLDEPEHRITVADVMAAKLGDRGLLPALRAARGDLSASDRGWLDRVGGSVVGGRGRS
jgi:MOSC domain-containing protein YiiM